MKLKKLCKTCIVTGMIVLSAAFLFTGCGTDAKTEEEKTASDPVVENPAAEQTENDQQQWAERYEVVLSQYRDMVQNDFYEALQDTEEYESSFGQDIGFEIRNQKQNIYYALYDLDGNGTEELVIAGGEGAASAPDFAPWNYDLYGYDGTKVVHLFPDVDFGYRTNFSLYDNGIIEVFYSSSAAESGVDFYKIGADGITPELVDSFAISGRMEEDETIISYLQNGSEITEEAYNEGIQSYEVPLSTALDWIQIQ